jgi:hypothetical protein
MIDAVYTWVDANDPLWLKEFQKSVKDQGGKPEKASVHLCRFRDYGELFYSLLSLEKFAPWIRQIHIVKKSYQAPNLNNLPEHTLQKIVWIDEIKLCPPEINLKEFSPTFNSLAIEANLHRIPGLSEKFIYFNNDMFIGKPLEPEYFFSENSARFSLRSELNWQRSCKNILGHPKIALIKGYLRYILNSYAWFNQKIGSTKPLGLPYGSTPVHQCTPLFKSSFHFAWEHAEIKPKLLLDSQQRFRAESQLHPVFFVSLINLWRGKARLTMEEDVFIQLNNLQFKKQLAALTQQRAFRFCVNDNPRNKNAENTVKTMTQFMQEYFY